MTREDRSRNADYVVRVPREIAGPAARFGAKVNVPRLLARCGDGERW